MRFLAPLPLHGGALRPERLEACRPEPALQSPRVRQVQAGKPRGQLQPDQAGAPLGVLPLGHECRLVKRTTGLGLLGPTAIVVGLQPRLALVPKAVPPVADGGGRKLEMLGNGRQRLSLLMPVDNLLS